MPIAVVKLPNLVTSAGGTASSPVSGFGDAWALSIASTDAIFTSTAVTVTVCMTTSGTDFVTLMSGDESVLVFPSANRIISPTPFMQLRVEHSGAEAAERQFHVRKTILT